MSAAEKFQRTTCACDACRVGCKTMPWMLTIGDFERIAHHLGKAADIVFLTENFVASEGAKVGRFTENGIETFQIPTITPAQKHDGSCVFLQKDGACGVHPVAPWGCSHVDTHMTAEEGEQRVAAALNDVRNDWKSVGQYLQLWRLLVAACKLSRPRAARRRAFERAFAKVNRQSLELDA